MVNIFASGASPSFDELNLILGDTCGVRQMLLCEPPVLPKLA